MNRNAPLLRFLVAFCALLGMSLAGEETYSYTFANATDGTNWPNVLADGDSVSEGFDVYNEINNAVMFTANYVAAGNASLIDGEALWGNPRHDSQMNSPYVDFEFDDFFAEDEIDGEWTMVDQVTSVSFDFAWANSAGNPTQPPPLEAVDIEVTAYDGSTVSTAIQLAERFPHGLGGSGQGWQGRVVLAAADLGLENIEKVVVDLGRLLALGDGFTTEFAIDNLDVIVNGEEGPPPSPSNVFPVSRRSDDGLTGYYTNSLRIPGNFTSINDVRNDGETAATFTVTLTAGDPAFHQPEPVVNEPIDPLGRVLGAVSWEVDREAIPSGTYTGHFLVVNDTNPEDPDNRVDFTFELYDPPELTDNAGAPVELPGAGRVTVSNAAAGPHAGALRASVKVAGLSMSNPAFTLSGIAAGDQLDPGQSLTGAVSFDPGNLPAGTYTGELRMKLEMAAQGHGFLNYAQPVPDIVWNLRATVGGVPEDTVSVAPGEDIGDSGLGISDPDTGVTILGGVSGEAQDVTLSFNENPPEDGTAPVVTPFDVTFTGTAPVYVLAVSYSDDALPPGRSEMDLRIEVHDPNTGAWVPAESLNSDPTPPAGAAPYAGSFDSYLTTLGGGALDDADLGAFGVDAENNQAWVVIDHASTFRLVARGGESIAPPKTYGIDYDPATNTATITYQSVSGEVFGVQGWLVVRVRLQFGGVDVAQPFVEFFGHPFAGFRFGLADVVLFARVLAEVEEFVFAVFRVFDEFEGKIVDDVAP